MAPGAARRVLLVHGAATTSAVWDPLRSLLEDLDVMAPDRSCTGDLAVELDLLTELAEDAIVVGVSGGATLGLALASSSVALAGAVLHEPAVGSLVPGLLDHVVAGYASGGVPGFAGALYGPAWTPAMGPADQDAVARDLGMFRRFEPSPVRSGQGPVVVTVGSLSPSPRHRAARLLGERMGVETRTLAACGHFVQHERPHALAEVVRELIARTG